MEIKIKSKSKKAVADVISYCLFSAFREHDDSVRSIGIIDRSCDFYRKLKSTENTKQSITVFSADDAFCSSLCALLENYIYDAAADLANDQMEWLCDVMDFYHQILPVKDANIERDHETVAKMKKKEYENKKNEPEKEIEEDNEKPYFDGIIL